MNTWKVILAALVIFGTGLVTGAILGKVTEAKPAVPATVARPNNNNSRPGQTLPLEHLRRLELMGRVQRELNLTAEQRRRIEKIIGDGQEHVRELWEEVEPDIHGELRDVQQKLCTELTPDQKQRFNQLMKQQHSHRVMLPTNAPPAKTVK